MNMSWSQECVAIMQKSPKETYLISKNLVIRKRNLFDLGETYLISKNLVIRKRNLFDLKRKVFDFF